MAHIEPDATPRSEQRSYTEDAALYSAGEKTAPPYSDGGAYAGGGSDRQDVEMNPLLQHTPAEALLDAVGQVLTLVPGCCANESAQRERQHSERQHSE